MSLQEDRAPHPFVVTAGEGEQLPLIGNLRLSDAQTGRGFEVIEYTGPATPPPHVHRDHDEVFYIIEGGLSFVLGKEPVEAREGALVFVPRGTRHGFTVEAGSKALLFIIPGGLGGFFRELGAGLAAGKPSAEIRARLAGKYDSFPETQ
jgi:mannose-6-phosphate isomerase-like protein (cupin superfamily)